MEIQRIEAIIEAVLFASGDAISVERLCEIAEVDRDTMQSIIFRLSDAYNYQKRGIRIVQIGDKYQMATRGEFAEYVQKII